MSNIPPEDLVIAARKIDPQYHAEVNGPWIEPGDDAAGWRTMVPPSLRRMWGRLDYETRLAVFVIAASEREGDWPDPRVTDRIRPV